MMSLVASHLSFSESCKRPSHKMAHVAGSPSTLTLITRCSSFQFYLNQILNGRLRFY